MAQARAQRAPQVDVGARSRRAAARRPRRDAPREAANERARRRSSSSAVSSAKSLRRSISCALQVRRAPETRRVSAARRLAAPGPPSGASGAGLERRPAEAGAARRGRARSSAERRPLGGLAPERLEGRVEDGQVLAPARSAERPRGVAEVGASRRSGRARARRRGRASARCRRRARGRAGRGRRGGGCRARCPAHPAARTRSRIAARRLAAHLLDVVLVLEEDAERVVDHRDDRAPARSSATSAAAQSSVSATPGSL